MRIFPPIVLASVLMAAPMYSQSAQTAKGKPPTPPTLLLGAAWYPEQWPESRWKTDLRLMQKAHIHMVRMGEYT